MIAAKQTIINEVYGFSLKYRYINIAKYSVDKTFWVIKVMDLIGLDPDATILFFLTPVPANKMKLFHT